MLKIRALQEGFRRSGKAFSKTFAEFPDDAFTKEQLTALEAEPMIVVEYVPDDDVEDVETASPDLEGPAEPNTPDTGVGAGPTLEQLKAAAGRAIEDGNTIGSGKPSVEAMEETLGCNISSEQRDQGYEAFKQEADA